MPRILMCPPDHYGIEYEINPWMNRSLGAVRTVAFLQWTKLRETLEFLGAQIEQLEPRAGLPDLVFTANAGLMFKKLFLSSRFKHEVRAKESPVFEAWFAAHGFEVGGVDLRLAVGVTAHALRQVLGALHQIRVVAAQVDRAERAHPAQRGHAAGQPVRRHAHAHAALHDGQQRAPAEPQRRQPARVHTAHQCVGGVVGEGWGSGDHAGGVP